MIRRILITLALTTLVVLAQAKPTEEAAASLLKPTAEEGKAGEISAQFLTRFHYKPMPLDDAMSEKIFDRYFEALDSERVFFTKADVDKFAASRDKLDDAIYQQDLSIPFAIYNIYEQRIGERITYARGLLTKGFDFSKNEIYQYDREKAPWARDQAELDDLWGKRVKNDWLRLKLASKADKQIRETLNKRYGNYLERVRQLKSSDVFQTFMNAYAMAIEPHTNYLSPRAGEEFDILMKLSLEGIGAVLQREDEYTAIREIVPGGPVALSGKFKVGDRIVGVGQGEAGPVKDVIGWRLDDVVDMIRGAKDTVVKLEVLPVDAGLDSKPVLIALTRKKVSVEGQAAKKSVIEVKSGAATQRVGVILLPTFYQDFDAHRRGEKDYKSATRDVARLLNEFKQQKIDGVIVDLRNNGGGSLAEATELTGLFIDKGPVVQVRSANGRIDEEKDTDPGMAWDGPLAVLVNRGSASASEIFAAAIQDYGRGIIIGEPTFGKGTVQNLVNLDELARNEKPAYGELKMTIAQFFRINGASTQLRGVTPDINFPLSVDASEFGESSFDNALPWTSIAPADYKSLADLKPVIPMLITRHETRVAKDQPWQFLQEDIAQARKLRAEKTVSLNETVRRKERDEQEAKRKARDQAEASMDKNTTLSSSGENNKSESTNNQGLATNTKPDMPSSTPPLPIDNAVGVTESSTSPNNHSITRDDGLQPSERKVSEELKREQEQKAKKDIVLDEAAHIIADEIDLIHSDTRLATQILPHLSKVNDAN